MAAASLEWQDTAAAVALNLDTHTTAPAQTQDMAATTTTLDTEPKLRVEGANQDTERVEAEEPVPLAAMVLDHPAIQEFPKVDTDTVRIAVKDTNQALMDKAKEHTVMPTMTAMKVQSMGVRQAMEEEKEGLAAARIIMLEATITIQTRKA